MTQLQSIGAVVTTLIGVAFFFVIIGVFGLSAASGGLATFIVVSVLIIHHSRDKETRG